MSLTVFCALIESCSVQMGMCFVHKEFQLELQVYFCHPIKMLCSSTSTVSCHGVTILVVLYLFSKCRSILSCSIYNAYYDK